MPHRACCLMIVLALTHVEAACRNANVNGAPQGQNSWNLSGKPPYLVAHYLAWFEVDRSATEARRTWTFWRWKGPGPLHNPEHREANGRRDIASVIYPLIGTYSSWDRAAVRYHMETAHAVGIRAFLVDWYGPGSAVDERMSLLLEEAERVGMRIAICYEEKLNFFAEYRVLSSRTAIVDAVTADLTYILRRYGTHPAYLKRNDDAGRPAPLILQFNAWGFSDELGTFGLTPSEFATVFSRLPASLVYVRQNLDDRYHPSILSTYVWWTWDAGELDTFSDRAASLRNAGQLAFFMAMIGPGFDDSGVWGWGAGPRRSATYGDRVLTKTMERALRNGPELVQIVTWNDFPEATAVEPTLDHGYQWLDQIERWWGQVAGRPVNLDDNRTPFRSYVRTSTPRQRAEIPQDAYRIANQPVERQP